MKIKIILTSMGIFFPVLFSFAQYATDALRYSSYNLSGTARFQGIGGAQTALGADLGSVSGNPAGMGFYKKSEWSISSALGAINTKTSYLPSSNSPTSGATRDSKVNFNIPNIGIVFSSDKDDIVPGKWRGGSFGISFNRVSNFQNRFSYDGLNQQTSLADYFVEQASGVNPEDLDQEIQDGGGRPSSVEAQAYKAYIVNPLSGADFPYDRNEMTKPARQQELYNSSGAQYQWNFSYGGNIADKFYLGASLGITRLRYSYKREFTETYENPELLRGFSFDDDLAVTGTGVNLSAGLIYRPNDIIRFGASLVTPTFYNISEEYNSTLAPDFMADAVVDDGEGGEYHLSNLAPIDANPNLFTYKLQTPWRFSGGVAFFLGKKGFVSADVEYVTFNTMNLTTSDLDANGNNNFKQRSQNGISERKIVGIKDFVSVINFKVGGEFRQGIYRLRAGFGYQADPYKQRVDNINRRVLNVSLGGGIRLTNYYFDVAAVQSIYTSAYSPYTLASRSYPSATIQNSYTNLVFTFGTFF